MKLLVRLSVAIALCTSASAFAHPRRVIQQTTLGKVTPQISWAGFEWSIAWKKERPRVIATRARRSTVVFQADDKSAVYWGEPLRVSWLANDSHLLVRLVEYASLGSPAYAACLLLKVVDGAPVLIKSAQPERDRDCPKWASPLTDR